MKTKRNFNLKSQIRSVEGDNNTLTIEGVIPYNSRSVNLGGFVEEISSSAFTKTLNDNANVRLLFNHDDSKVLACSKNGSLRMTSDDEGLHWSADLVRTSYGLDAYTLIQSGTVDTLSFGFSPIQVEHTTTESGYPLDILREVRLYEISCCVSTPAYPETHSEARNVRGIDLDKVYEALSKEERSEEDVELLRALESVINDLLPKEEKEEPVEEGAEEKTETAVEETQEQSERSVTPEEQFFALLADGLRAFRNI